MEIHLQGREIVCGGASVALTSREHDLLAYLMARPGVTVSLDELKIEVWRYAPRTRTRAPFQTVQRLRQKLRFGPDQPELIATVSGEGYRWVGPATPEGPRTSYVPAQLDRFFGREAELERLVAAISTRRLVTLTGPGGVGKTRLGLALAERLLDRTDGGVWFCDASAATSAEGLDACVAEALRADPAELERRLATAGEILLILDNLEQVLAPAAERIEGWLTAARRLRILGTSRERLGIRGEEELPLLPIPAEEGAALFLDRARAAGAVPEDLPPEEVLGIVELLDRLPLALELAAARTRTLSLPELSERLSRGDPVLNASKGWPARQLSLSATLEWSWDLLSPVEQGVLAQLSVFEGGFSLASAEAILDPASLDPEPADGVLEALLDKHLLGSGSSDRALRFGMLRTIRAFSAQKADELGLSAGASRRHRAWFGRHDPDRLRRLSSRERRALSREADDYLAASASGLVDGDPDGAARAALALCLTTADFGVHPSARERMERAYAAGPSPRLQGQLAVAIGRISGRTDLEAAGRWASAALAAAERIGDRGIEGLGLLDSAILARYRGRSEEARALAERASERFRLLGDRWHEGRAECAIGALCNDLRDREGEAAAYQRALALHQAASDLRGEIATRLGLAVGLGQQGRHDEAEAVLTRCLQIARDDGDAYSQMMALQNLASLEGYRQRPERALALHREAAGLAERVGNARALALVLGALGAAELGLELPEARPRLLRALQIARDAGQGHPEGLACLWLARADARAADAPSARRWLSEARRLLGSQPRYRLDLLCAEAEAALAAGSAEEASGALERARQALLALPDPSVDQRRTLSELERRYRQPVSGVQTMSVPAR